MELRRDKTPGPRDPVPTHLVKPSDWHTHTPEIDSCFRRSANYRSNTARSVHLAASDKNEKKRATGPLLTLPLVFREGYVMGVVFLKTVLLYVYDENVRLDYTYFLAL